MELLATPHESCSLTIAHRKKSIVVGRFANLLMQTKQLIGFVAQLTQFLNASER